MHTELQSRAQMSMWAIMSAPLLISADVGQVTNYSLTTWGNEEIIAVSQNFRAGGPYQGARVLAAGGDNGNLNFGAVAGGGWTGSGHNVWGKLLPGDDFVRAPSRSDRPCLLHLLHLLGLSIPDSPPPLPNPPGGKRSSRRRRRREKTARPTI